MYSKSSPVWRDSVQFRRDDKATMTTLVLVFVLSSVDTHNVVLASKVTLLKKRLFEGYEPSVKPDEQV